MRTILIDANAPLRPVEYVSETFINMTISLAGTARPTPLHLTAYYAYQKDCCNVWISVKSESEHVVALPARTSRTDAHAPK